MSKERKQSGYQKLKQENEQLKARIEELELQLSNQPNGPVPPYEQPTKAGS